MLTYLQRMLRFDSQKSTISVSTSELQTVLRHKKDVFCMTNSAIRIVLGFDFGMKRIGVAVGQTVTQSARPLETLQANQGVPRWEKVDKLMKAWQPDALVVGIPLNMDGTEQPLTLHAQGFLTSLIERYQLPCYGVDERLSTKDARERLFQQGGYKALQNGQVDRVAAQLILQNWLSQLEQDE